MSIFMTDNNEVLSKYTSDEEEDRTNPLIVRRSMTLNFVAVINVGGIKIMMLYFNGYENDTTTNDTITFPIAYVNAPTVIAGSSTLPAMSATATVLTITSPDATTTYTGTAIIAGV